MLFSPFDAVGDSVDCPCQPGVYEEPGMLFRSTSKPFSIIFR